MERLDRKKINNVLKRKNLWKKKCIVYLEY